MRTSFIVVCVLLSAFILPTSGVAQSPQVNRIEPPNWWADMKLQQLVLMVYGDNLESVEAKFNDQKIKVHLTSSGKHAFIDISTTGLDAGSYELELIAGGESLFHSYELLERKPRQGRNQGFDINDVVYLITPDRFANGDLSNDTVDELSDEYNPSERGMRHGGDLQGITDRLDYIADLGVTTIWLNPVLENNGENSYHGYAATDLYKVDARFGGNEAYLSFVEEAHARGLKVIFDHINNHIGINHPWIENLPTPTWLNGSVENHLSGKHYMTAISDPHSDPISTEQMQSFWFVDSMPDLNQRDPFVSTYLTQNMIWWMEYAGIDGIREDTYPYPFPEHMIKWETAILDEYPQSNIVGEIWNNSPAFLAQYQAGFQGQRAFETNLPTIMDFPLSTALRQYVSGEGKLRDVQGVIAQDFVYPDLTGIMTMIDNHDMTRAIYLADGKPERVKQALAILLTTRGIPQLLYGSEINMLGGESHVELRQDFPGGFPGHERSAFTPEGRTKAENEIFDYVRSLLHLRKKHEALRSGKLVHYGVQWFEDAYKYVRLGEEDKFLIVVNGKDVESEVNLIDALHWFEGEEFAGEFENVLNGENVRLDSDSIAMDAYGVVILRSLGTGH